MFDFLSLLVGFGFGFGVCMYIFYVLLERKGIMKEFVDAYGNEKHKEKYHD